VLAIIGTLCGLLFPSFGGARRTATAARTKAQFARWTTAIESFRDVYGHYPTFAADNLVNGGAIGLEHPFHDVLAGRHRDGSILTPGSPAALQNHRAIVFHVFDDLEFDADYLLQDAANHRDMAVLVDRDLDGLIKAGADFVTLPAVNGLTPGSIDFPAVGIRAGVLFYAPAPGATAAKPGFVFSWK
jgi:type II secretory pathway pseudopilin PulG